MSTLANSSIDDLLERREVTNRIVHIPRVTQQNMAEILKRLQGDRSLTLPTGEVDPSTLHDRLREITPPVDEEKNLEECRALERDARAELEREGCPPCYPSYLDIPLQNVPPEYQAITSYWQAISVPGDVVLCAQRSDWKRFRENQTRWRRTSGFSQHMASIRKQDVDVSRTHIDPSLRAQLENWEEFEYYHNMQHKKFKNEYDDWTKKRDEAEKNPDMSYIAHMGLTQVQVCEKRRQLSLAKVQAHEVLLRWIKEKKSEMMTRIPKAKHSRHTEEVRVSRPGQRQSRHRIAMTEPQNTTKKTTGRAEPANKVRQARAKRLPKVRQSFDAGAQRGRALGGIETRTRSGRISKPPARWAPG